MDKMDKNSKPYKEGGYSELFDSAESSNVVGEDAVLYSQSLSYLREVQAGLDFRYEEGIEKGIEKGKREGIKEGIEKERMDTARRMKAAGSDMEFISLITGLSQDKIAEL